MKKRLRNFKQHDSGHRTQWLELVFMGLIVSVSCGCQSKTPLIPVEGTLVFNEQPLVDVLVTFIPVSTGDDRPLRSMAISDSAGKFVLRAETQQMGAVLGEHCVILEDLAILNAPRDAEGTVTKQPPIRFPTRYSNPLTSPLKATVQKNQEPIAIVVTGR